VLVGGLRVVVDEAARHHQVLRDPVAVVALEGAQLAERSAVQLTPGDVRIDLWRALAIRPVRDAEV
jgi:hypothetical protein